MLRGDPVLLNAQWSKPLAKDLCQPRYHVSLARAAGRRLRRTYGWIFLVQALAYYGKLAIHPTPRHSVSQLWARAAIGPIPGEILVAAGVLFHLSWMIFGYTALRRDPRAWRLRQSLIAIG